MSVRDRLGGKPLLFDGGMGSYYAQKYGFDPECCERANLLYPARIAAIHREYIAAVGAENHGQAIGGEHGEHDAGAMRDGGVGFGFAVRCVAVRVEHVNAVNLA